MSYMMCCPVIDKVYDWSDSATNFKMRKTKKKIAVACDNVISVSFDQFKSQVVAYLPAEFRDYYGTTQTWEELQQKVLTALQAL